MLLGARATGKSTLLRGLLPAEKTFTIDLLDPVLEQSYALYPNRFRADVVAAHERGMAWIFVDEIQRAPKLLNIIHSLIESHRIKFAITGSSARKLRRGAANLLAGRAFLYHLFPLTSLELKEAMDLQAVLTFGALPKLWDLPESGDKIKYLQSYTATFVREEVQAEQLVRRLDPFRKFLEVAAQSNAKILNYANIARDVGVDNKTVQSYYQILEDTLIGIFLEPFHTSVRKVVGAKPKFYFFDIGVMRTLAGQVTTVPAESTANFGELFETFIVLECHRLNHYFEKDYQFFFLRTKDDVEIDLIVKRPGKTLVLIEIKSSTDVKPEHLRKFDRLASDFPKAEKLCISRDLTPQTINGVRAMPWREALAWLFGQQ